MRRVFGVLSDRHTVSVFAVGMLRDVEKNALDAYSQTSGVYNGGPVWRGVKNGYLAYMCGGKWAGRWMFTGGSTYLANRKKCAGVMILLPSGKWQVVRMVVPTTKGQLKGA